MASKSTELFHSAIYEFIFQQAVLVNAIAFSDNYLKKCNDGNERFRTSSELMLMSFLLLEALPVRNTRRFSHKEAQG